MRPYTRYIHTRISWCYPRRKINFFEIFLIRSLTVAGVRKDIDWYRTQTKCKPSNWYEEGLNQIHLICSRYILSIDNSWLPRFTAFNQFTILQNNCHNRVLRPKWHRPSALTLQSLDVADSEHTTHSYLIEDGLAGPTFPCHRWWTPSCLQGFDEIKLPSYR